MWISKAVAQVMANHHAEVTTLRNQLIHALTSVEEVRKANARLQGDLDWAKHRLNQVERERGQLIAAACGVKVAVPEFVPTFNPDQALNPQNDPFTDLGPEAEAGQAQQTEVDYSLMPGFVEKK